MTARGLEFLFLGGFTVQWDGEPLPPIPSRIGRSLLAYLTAHHERNHRRESLAARFWPDLPTQRARRRLSHALWQIQDTLGDVPGGDRFIEATPDTLRIDPDAVFTLDAAEFERIAETVRGEDDPPTDRLVRVREALDTYGGDFLSGMHDDWVLAEQERLAQLLLTVLSRGIGAAKAVGEYEEALAYARRLTHYEPLREDAHREAMRLCVLLGRTSEALAQYERCRSVLEEELGAEPAEATTDLRARIARHRRQSGEPLPVAELEEEAPGLAVSNLVGRERERSRVVEHLEQALSGRPGVVFIEGDPGVGKSRLASAVTEDAEWRGISVLWGGCDELGAGRPYAPIVEALGAALSPVRVQQLRPRVDPVWLSEAAAAIPALRRVASPDPRQPLGGFEGAQRMRGAIAQVLLGHTEIHPTLLVIEDLHWADEETLELLHVLGSRIASHRLVLVLTFRSAEAREHDAVWQLLRRLDQVTAPERITLGPLGEDHVREMLRWSAGPHLPPEVAARVIADTGGNPLFVVETLRALQEGGHLDASEEPLLEELPLARTVQETIEARLGSLTEVERDVLEVVAVHGRDIELDTILAASDRPAVAVADAIEGLVGRGFLAEEGEAYVLNHDLTRRIIYRGLSTDDRRGYHASVATALESAHPEDVDALAWHFTAADEPAKAVRYLVLAADRATAIHAYDVAARHRRAVLDLVHRVPMSLDARYELLAAHESVLDVLGRRDEQAAVLEQMAELVADDPAAEVETRRRQAWLLLHTDRFEEAIAVARAALEVARRSGDVDTQARLLTTIGTGFEWSGHRNEAVDAHEGAVGLATDDRDRMEAELALGNALRGVQRYGEAASALRRALVTASKLDDRRQQVRILGALANVHAEVGETGEAASRYRQALEAARTIGFRHGEGVNLLNLATVQYQRGEIAESMRLFDDASRILDELGNRRLVALAAVNAASARIEVLGDLDAALADLEAALAFFTEVGDLATAAHCEQLIGRAHHMRGEATEARRRSVAALARLDEEPNAWLEVQFRRDLAETELEMGEPQRAIELLDEALDACRALGLTDLAVGIAALRGRSLLALGRTTEGLETSEQAVAQLGGGVERPHLVHWAHHLALNAAGRQHEAEGALLEAHRLLHGLLEGLDPAERERALTAVPTSAAIEAAIDERRAEVVEVRIAQADAPTGRALADEERTRVAWTVRTPGDERVASPIERRRRRLLRLLDEAEAQRAAPTIEDLAAVLEVSGATVRRDLAALRANGHDLRTRGYRVG